MSLTAMNVIRDVGSRIETEWRRRNHDEKCFVEIAKGLLADAGLPDRISHLELLSEIAQSTLLCRSYDGFSDYAQVIYEAPRFYIELLTWLDGTTAIHQHGFSGAFQVLAGSSVQTTYSYVAHQELNQQLAIGELRWKNSEFCPPGALSGITAGPDFIHSLFHLEKPSVTLVVRTRVEACSGPQFSYWQDGFRKNPFYRDYTLEKQVRALSMLWYADRKYCLETAESMIASGTVDAVLKIVELLSLKEPSKADDAVEEGLTESENLPPFDQRFPRLARAAQERFGEDLTGRMIEHGHQVMLRDAIVALRKKVSGVDPRYLLAVLMCVPNPPASMKVFKQKYPDDDPVARIVSAVKELSEPQPRLGIDFDESSLYILAAMVRGNSLDELVRQMNNDFGQEQVGDQIGLLRQNYDAIRGARILRSIVPI